MNREEIIRMAREAGAEVTDYINYHYDEDMVLFGPDELARFAALVAAAERERIKAEHQQYPYGQPLYSNGCPVCGLGADGKVTGYVCYRNDCPTRITCVGAA